MYKIITKTIIGSIAFLLSISCQTESKKTTRIKRPSESESLSAKVVPVTEPIFIPSRIVAVENKLLIFDNVREGIFKVFDLPGLLHLYSAGNVGEGPDEFGNIDPYTLKNLNDRLFMLDGRHLISLDIEQDKIKPIQSHEITVIYNQPINRLQMVNDSTYIADVMDTQDVLKEHQIVHIQEQQVLGMFGEYPESELDFPTSIDKYQAFLKTSAVNPADGRFAAFYLNFNKAKFYDNTGELLKEVDIDGPTVKTSEQGPVLYRAEAVALEKLIFVLYVGMSKKDVEQNHRKFHPQLEIWDWEGNLLSAHMLDKPITAFTVSEKHGKIYGLSFFNTDEIYEYELSDFVKNIPQGGDVVNIENDFYSFQLPIDWIYAMATTEEEKNKLVSIKDISSNLNIFIPAELPTDKDPCGATLSIRAGYPHSKEYLLKDQFTTKNNILMSGQFHDYQVNNVSSDNGDIYEMTYRRKSTDPKGRESVLNCFERIWEEEGAFINASFCSCSEYETYFDKIMKSIASIKVKGQKQ